MYLFHIVYIVQCKKRDLWFCNLKLLWVETLHVLLQTMPFRIITVEQYQLKPGFQFWHLFLSVFYSENLTGHLYSSEQ